MGTLWMFPPVLWSSGEEETCQLSTRLHLDVSKPFGGMHALSRICSSHPNPHRPCFPVHGDHSGQQLVHGVLSASRSGSFLFISALSSTQDPWRLKPRGRRREKQQRVTLQGRGQLTALPLLLSLCAPTSPGPPADRAPPFPLG